jgi:hypothetical protein
LWLSLPRSGGDPRKPQPDIFHPKNIKSGITSIPDLIFLDEKYHVHPKLGEKIDQEEKYQVPQVWSQLTHTADQVNPKKLMLSAVCQLGLC